MFKDTVINQIRDLLQEPSMSQRKVAKMLGVSRSTVGRIARNEHRPANLPQSLPHSPSTGSPRNDIGRSIVPSECLPFFRPHGPYQKCPICGRRVKLPCLACQLESILGYTMEHLSENNTVSVTSLLSEYPVFCENS